MGVKISNLPAIVAPALSDIFPVVQSGITYKETGTQFSALLGSVYAPINSPVLITPTLGVATATSITFGGTALSHYDEGTWTPIITLVGGAGNTVPVYTVNSGVYTRIGNVVYCSVAFSGDGGAEGAGTGNFNISLPIAASASAGNTGFSMGVNGDALNNMTRYQLFSVIVPSAMVAALFYWSSVTAYAAFTGADQNNATRHVNVQFWYFV